MATKIVSFSELDNIKQCLFKHQLAYRERWTSEVTSPALAKGSLFHLVMETHYNALKGMADQGITPDWEVARTAVLAVPGLLFDGVSGAQDDTQEIVSWMYDGYLKQWESDSEWKIVGVEMPMMEWIPNRAGNRTSFKLKGKIDLVVRDQLNRLWIVDHKTGRNLPKGKDLDLDDQMALYIYLLRRAGIPVRGAIYNSIRSERLKRDMLPEERFDRQLLVRTDIELENIVQEALQQFQDAYRSREGDPPRSPNTDTCRWRCGFTEACLAGRKGGDTRQILGETGFEQDFTRH